MSSPASAILKPLGYAAVSLVGVAGLYLSAAFVLSHITVPKANPNAPADVSIFLHTNGVHTDLVLPIKNAQKDWTRQLPFSDIPSGDTTMQYVAFGWGDKGFYLDTPTWSQLKLSTAFVAAFWLGSSAMHTTFLHAVPPGPDTVPLTLSHAEYGQLLAYIDSSFCYDAAGRVQHIKGHSYGPDDAFYEARRVYSFLYTCNTWTNNALKASGQRACLWTPSDIGIFYQYGH